MSVPAIQLTELLEELAQLETQAARKSDPLDVSLLYLEPALISLGHFGVPSTFERRDFGTGTVV